LVLIGIHSDKDNALGKSKASELKMDWPVALDETKKSMEAFHCDSYPDYCLIDRKGNVRFCDIANGEIDKAIDALLKETP
jgi:hypothetical protein